MSDLPTSKGNGGGTTNVVFHYIKSQGFRVMHVDGIIGGLTPQGYIHMAIFSERPAIPQRMVHSFTPEAGLGNAIPSETVGKEGIVREVDADLILNLSTAKNLHSWLGGRIQELETALSQLPKGKSQ